MLFEYCRNERIFEYYTIVSALIYKKYTCMHVYHIALPSPLMQFGTSLSEIIDRKMGWMKVSSRGKNGYEYLKIEEGKKIIKLLLAHGAETEVHVYMYVKL